MFVTRTIADYTIKKMKSVEKRTIIGLMKREIYYDKKE